MIFTLIGQNTVCIDIDGVRCLTDPWWGSFECLRAVPLPIKPETLLPIDYMLVSHNHVDHWCKRAIDMAMQHNIAILGSTSAIRRAVKRGATNTKALTPGDTVWCKGFTVEAVPAYHPFAKDAIGFILKKDNLTFYFSGDTQYTDDLKKALTPYALTVAMLQVACSTYPMIGKDGMDLESAALFVQELQPHIVIPIHYHVKGKHLTDEQLEQWQINAKKIILKQGQSIAVDI
ncbi:MAG: MBL fold metallo-hydrolase [Spirochaetota bacterium]